MPFCLEQKKSFVVENEDAARVKFLANILGDAQSGIDSKRDKPKKENNRGRKKKPSDTASVS